MQSWKKRTRLVLLALIIVIVQIGVLTPQPSPVEAADNGLGAKPYMGWSSYSMQVYTTGSWITAANIKAQSDAMHEKLQPYGYNYINVDAGWNGGMDGYGRPVPSTTLYPDGLQDVIDHVHNNGQKFGLYMIPGLSPQALDDNLPIYGTACHMQDIVKMPLEKADYWGLGYKIDFSQTCAQSYITSIADLLGSWGVDFLKFDSVTPGSGISDLSLDARDDVKAWSEALAPHHIWLELSWALDIKYADTWKKYANGWRVDWDIECYCGTGGLTAWPSIARLFPKAEQWWRHAGAGGWNDFDSLNIGNGAMDGITPDERRTAMSLWAMSSAPLYIGNDMTNLDSYGIELLTNEEVIAVDQAGKPAHPVSTATDQQVWYANNGDGTYTVGLFNLGSSSATVTVNWNDIGLTGPASVRDLWSHTELGSFDTGYSSVDLPSHGSRLFKVTAGGGTSLVNDDDTGISYTGSWQRNGGSELAAASQNLAVEVGDPAAPNSTINPSTADFDKKESEQSDVTTTVALNGNELNRITNGAAELTAGTDYTIADNEVAIKKEYLAAQPLGTTNLTFFFSGGAARTLAVTIKDTTTRNSAVNPPTISFDKKQSAQADVSTTMELRGNQLDSIAINESALEEGTDYTVAGSVVTFKKAFLTSLPEETTSLAFSFDKGADKNVTLVIKDSSAGGSISVNDDDAGIRYEGAWNRSYNRGLGDYKDDVHFLENNGEYMEYPFTGTGIELYSELDPSQGDIDIYVDGDFKQTVSTSNAGRLANQSVYHIAGLTDGPHTLKAVKKSGVFMLVDQLKVTLPDLITPQSANFDKAASEQADVTAAIAAGRTLSGISGNGTPLAAGTDYAVTDDQVTIKKVYLAARPVGTANLIFSFSGGAEQVLAIEVADSEAQNSMISPAEASFDKNTAEQADVTTTLTLAGNALAGITSGGTPLVQGTDYTTDGNLVTIKKGYLAARPVGAAKLIFSFSRGASQTLSISISDTTAQNSTISPAAASFDQKQPAQSDITTTLTLGENSFSGIDNAGTPLIDGTDYTVSGSVVTIKKEYLSAQPIGMANLTFSFSAGQPQTLTVTVRDTARGRYIPVNNDDPDIFYDGAWQLGRNRGLGDYKDDVQYTEVTGDSFEYAFKGTGIEIITEKDSSQGDMDIYVDGELQQTVSAYSPSRQVQQPVFSIAGLADGPHTIKAVKKNGYYMLLDQLRVRVSDLISPDTASFDKSGAAQADVTAALAIDGSGLLGISNGNEALVPGEDYTASGNQVTIKKEYLASQPVGTTYLSFSLRGDYQNDVHVAEANGDYFEYPFTGTGIDFISAKDSSLGDIDIYVDNEFKQTVSAHSDSRQTQQALFSISGLTNGPHTIKGVKKSGAYMLVDGLRFSVTSVEDEDLAAVEQDKTELTVGLAEGDQADRVTRPVTLPALGAAGSGITWTSTRPDIINPQTGNITRPSRTEEDAVVTLEALIKKGAAAASRTFELTVPRSDSAQLGIAFTEIDYSLQVGQTKPTVVTATYEGGSQVVIADGIVYTMADPAVAQVSADGSISGVSQGETVISAVYNGFAAQAAIHVTAGDTPEAPQLSGLSFSNPEYTIINGESLNAQVAAVYDDGTEFNISEYAQYQIADPSVALAETGGKLTGTAGGKTVVTATYGGLAAEASIVVIQSGNPGSGGNGSVLPDTDTDDSASDYMLDLIDLQGNKQTVKVNLERVKEGIVTLAAGKGGGRFQLTAELLNAIRTANPDSIVEFQLPAAAFKLPLGELDLQKRLAAAGLEGSQWHLEVVAQQLDSSDEAGLNSGFQKDKLSQPVRFQIFLADGEGKSVPVTAFDSYVERTITVDKTDIPDSASAVWFDEQGEYRFAPATFEAANGQTTVTIKSKGTGTFALIQHPVSFLDMDQHWAEQAVNLLASKMIVQGRDAGGFDPRGAISRAEVSVLLVRALGLENQQGESVFPDVSGQWYDSSVLAAYQAGLIQGYADGSFKPDAPITREELAAILMRAVDYAGTPAVNPAQPGTYNDFGKISAWAQEAVNEATGLGIIQGDEDGAFKPDALSTRAETALMLYRMLDKLSFI